MMFGGFFIPFPMTNGWVSGDDPFARGAFCQGILFEFICVLNRKVVKAIHPFTARDADVIFFLNGIINIAENMVINFEILHSSRSGSSLFCIVPGSPS